MSVEGTIGGAGERTTTGGLSSGRGWIVVALSTAVAPGWAWVSIMAGWLRSGRLAGPAHR